MFTILENYKALMKMCMSANLAGGPELSAASIDKNGDAFADMIDFSQMSESEKVAVRGLLDKVGKEVYMQENFASKVENEGFAVSMQELIDRGYLPERGAVIANSQEYTAGVQGEIGAAGVVGAVGNDYYSLPVNGTVAANDIFVQAANNNVSTMSSGLSAVTDPALLDALGQPWEEGLRVDNFAGKDYIVEGGVWKVNTGISGTVETQNANVLKNFRNQDRVINKATAQNYPGQGLEVDGQTYKFEAVVDGVTKTIYAVWMEVSKGCFALSEPLTTVYEKSDTMFQECNYFVCDGAGCRAVPKQEITQTYVAPPAYVAPAPQPVVHATPHVEPPVYIQPPVEQPPVQQPTVLPEVLERCLSVESYLNYRTVQSVNSSFYDKVILNPTQADIRNIDPRYKLGRDVVTVRYQQVGGGIVEKEIPALITTKQSGMMYKYDRMSTNDYRGFGNKQVNFRDNNGDEQLQQASEPHEIFDSERCNTPFDIDLPKPDTYVPDDRNPDHNPGGTSKSDATTTAGGRTGTSTGFGVTGATQGETQGTPVSAGVGPLG
ncbi:hypothetical protein N9J72_02930 [Candidatus Gracilibacteria bacterium]|nr:hypothetical protein [Candidatus Gracilibacteria bacterium]